MVKRVFVSARLAAAFLAVAIAGCSSVPKAGSRTPTPPSTPGTPQEQSAAQAKYLAAVVPIPDALGPDVHAYNTTCSNTLTTASCLTTLTQFGDDMDGFLTTIAALHVPVLFQPGDAALRKALADLTGGIATLIAAITSKSPGVDDDAEGTVQAEGEVFPALGLITKEQAAVPAAAFAPADGTFSIVLAKGWSNVTGETALLAAHHLTGAELVAMQWDYLGPTEGIAVAYASVQQVTPPLDDAHLSAYLKTVVGGVKLLTQPAKFTLDGSSGLFDTTSATNAGNGYVVQDMVINHGGRTFEIVLTVLASAFNAELAGFNATMNAWRWPAA
jgi:hypothetical protein